MDYDVMRAAFKDELQKIAGELQGQTRIGRRPISVENYLERETESEVTPSSVTDELLSKTASSAARALALMGLGGLGADLLLDLGSAGRTRTGRPAAPSGSRHSLPPSSRRWATDHGQRDPPRLPG